MITILIADDHPVVRSGIRAVLHGDPEMRIAGEAQNGAEALQEVTKRHFDIILLDVRLPDGNSVELISRLRASAPRTRIVMFTNAEEEAERALAAGAAAFLTKNSLASELKATIKTVTAGGSVVSKRIEGRLGSSWQPAHHAHETLSARELEIMLKLISGQSPKDIALELGIGDKTVYTHSHRLMKKIGVSDVRGLMLYAMRNGLIDWTQ